MDGRKMANKLSDTLDGRGIRWQGIVVALCDAIIVVVAFFSALFIRYDFSFSAIDEIFLIHFSDSIAFFVAAVLIVFFFMKLYQSIWRYVGVSELIRLSIAYCIFIPLMIIFTKLTDFAMPKSYYVIGYVFSFIGHCTLRIAYRVYRSFLSTVERSIKTASSDVQDIMIVGAGAAGQMLLREINESNKVHLRVRCYIDDNPAKKGRYVGRVKIVGGREEIPNAVKKYNISHIYIAMPAENVQTRKEIYNICNKTGCKLMTVPGVYQLLNGDVRTSALKEVNVEDLLGRDPIRIDDPNVNAFLADKTVLVTGGGGSIGSELCRQIAKNGPHKLIILDIYENNAYAIQNELLRDYPNINLTVLIGSVRDIGRLDYIFKKYRPDAVFHAAAHKHVPLMEQSPNEAIKNNCGGTLNVALKAMEYNTKNFILISTDKAVRPTSLMGASKRICEMIIQMCSRKGSNTEFSIVRFGNVLGSAGSVIPLFKEQIKKGGPVTVTHKDIIRYFMTIPEAVSLILQASIYAKGGEIFVLDMGEPVRIYDLAENLIRLSGYKPGVDIDIKVTGLRPGEKLYEELLMNEEGLQKTDNNLIYIANPIEMDDAAFDAKLNALLTKAQENGHEIKEAVRDMVDTYKITDND